jgi:outer membrane protein assembly factor BamB
MKRIHRGRAAAVSVLLAAAATGCGAGGHGAARRDRRPAPVTAATRAVTVRRAGASGIPSGDWRTFDYNAQRSGVGPADTGIKAGNLDELERRTVQLPGTVDSSPLELHAVRVAGRVRDLAILTTSYGITVALDPGTGRILWQFRPGDLGSLQGTRQITTSTPIVDPDRRYVYTTSPDGYVHKLRVSDGRPVWSRSVTFDPSHEKLAGALNIEGDSLIVPTDGYNGDAPPYQGHVVTIDRATGHITQIFNSLCSNVRHLLGRSECPYSDSAIWGRSGSVIEPGTGRILVATGNGTSKSVVTFNGHTNWSDSVLELSPSLQLLHNYTPADQLHLTQADLDLGSTEPALLPKVAGLRLAVQSGKDGILRLLDLGRLDGTTGGAGPRTGGELQDIAAPGPTEVLTEPAVWSHRGRVYVFVADNGGTTAYALNARHRLYVVWQDATPGTSPIVAGGLLYVYNEMAGTLVVRDPVSGRSLDTLPARSGHWNSPIVVSGRIILPEGDDNQLLTTGTLDIYHLPGR